LIGHFIDSSFDFSEKRVCTAKEVYPPFFFFQMVDGRGETTWLFFLRRGFLFEARWDSPGLPPFCGNVMI